MGTHTYGIPPCIHPYGHQHMYGRGSNPMGTCFMGNMWEVARLCYPIRLLQPPQARSLLLALAAMCGGYSGLALLRRRIPMSKAAAGALLGAGGAAASV